MISYLKHLKGKIKKQIKSVYSLCSDGDLMEGIAQEPVAVAGLYKLNNLTLFSQVFANVSSFDQ